MHTSSGRSASDLRLERTESPAQPDVRDTLFAPLAGRVFHVEVTACADGVLAGGRQLADRAAEIPVKVEWLSADGGRVAAGACVCRVSGEASQVARAEEILLGAIAKASGVATAAAEMVARAAGRARIVCGAWKKVAFEARPGLRAAIAAGGAAVRMMDTPFVYLDKNHVRMLGGVVPALRRARAVEGRAIVVQLRGETAPIAIEAESAMAEGADAIMVDTGAVDDLAAVTARVRSRPGGGRVLLAFGGGVTTARLNAVIAAGAQAVDVGRAIIDAPLLDFRLDVVTRAHPWS